jgi:SH3-like domain-containing protein
MFLRQLVILAFLLFPAFSAQAAATNANTSGLPIPRFVSLKSEETNVRTGPGTRYPIQWVYHRAGMPVEVIEEFEHWRKIRDMDGTAGWVHKTMVLGTRNVLIKAKDDRIVRVEPSAKGRPLLKVEPQVIAKLAECEKEWCRIQVTGRKGWIEKKYLFGVYPDEIID